MYLCKSKGVAGYDPAWSSSRPPILPLPSITSSSLRHFKQDNGQHGATQQHCFSIIFAFGVHLTLASFFASQRLCLKLNRSSRVGMYQNSVTTICGGRFRGALCSTTAHATASAFTTNSTAIASVSKPSLREKPFHRTQLVCSHSEVNADSQYCAVQP